jgi:hypothetical protein
MAVQTSEHGLDAVIVGGGFAALQRSRERGREEDRECQTEQAGRLSNVI